VQVHCSKADVSVSVAHAGERVEPVQVAVREIDATADLEAEDLLTWTLMPTNIEPGHPIILTKNAN
jgi:hypothetical protein